MRRAARLSINASKLAIEQLTTGVVLNPMAATFIRNPYPKCRSLREKDPVHWSRLLNAWVISLHKDVDAFLRDDRRFSSQPPGGEPPWPGSGNLLDMDPPDHTRLRSLISQAKPSHRGRFNASCP